MYRKIIALGDTHIPFIDQEAYRAVIKFLKDFSPQKVIFLGDLLDLWVLSDFSRDPQRLNTLQEDIEKSHTYLVELREAIPKADLILLFGNHEDRARRYCWKIAPELSTLKILRLENLLGLDDLHIKYYTRNNDYHREGQLLFTHGTVISQQSSVTGRRHLQKLGESTVVGHSHRLGSYYETKIGGSKGAWENGCLCDLELAKEWRQTFPPNWQQGFSVIFMKKKRFFVNQVYISKGEFLFQGEEFSGKE